MSCCSQHATSTNTTTGERGGVRSRGGCSQWRERIAQRPQQRGREEEQRERHEPHEGLVVAQCDKTPAWITRSRCARSLEHLLRAACGREAPTNLPEEFHRHLFSRWSAGVEDDRLRREQGTQRLRFLELRKQRLGAAQRIEVPWMARPSLKSPDRFGRGATAVNLGEGAPAASQPGDRGSRFRPRLWVPPPG